MSEVRANIAPFFDHSLNVTPNGRMPAAVRTSWHMICWSHEDSCERKDLHEMGSIRLRTRTREAGIYSTRAPIGAPRINEHGPALVQCYHVVMSDGPSKEICTQI